MIKHSFSFIQADSVLLKSSFSLLVALFFQSFILFPYLWIKKKNEIISITKNLKIPFFIGSLSGVGSFCLFIAFAIAYVAYVKTLGQIEFILSIFVSVYYFKEKIYKNEIFGIILMAIGTIILIFA